MVHIMEGATLASIHREDVTRKSKIGASMAPKKETFILPKFFQRPVSVLLSATLNPHNNKTKGSTITVLSKSSWQIHMWIVKMYHDFICRERMRQQFMLSESRAMWMTARLWKSVLHLSYKMRRSGWFRSSVIYPIST